MAGRNAADDLVQQALLDGEIAEPGGQRHPNYSAEQQVDALRAAIVAIARTQQQHAVVLVKEHQPEFSVESRRQLQRSIHAERYASTMGIRKRGRECAAARGKVS